MNNFRVSEQLKTIQGLIQKTFLMDVSIKSYNVGFLWDMKSLHDQCIFFFHKKQDKETWLCRTYLDDFFRSHLDHIRKFLNLIWIFYNFGHVWIFTEWAPLGRFSHRVAMSLCVCVCAIESQGSKGGPRGAKQSPIVFEASHWPSGHMISSSPLIGPPNHPPYRKKNPGNNFFVLSACPHIKPRGGISQILTFSYKDTP